MDHCGVVLRHRYIQAQLVGVGNVEQLWIAVGIGLDQLADIGIACGDGAGERRAQGLVVLQCRQPRNVCNGGLDVGLGRCRVGGFLIGFLTRYRMAGQKVLPARRGGRCKVRVRLFLNQSRMGLGQLLIEVGAVDFGQHLPGLYLAADVDLPVLQVTADSCMNRCGAPGFQVRGQAQGVAGGIVLRLEYADMGMAAAWVQALTDCACSVRACKPLATNRAARVRPPTPRSIRRLREGF